MKNQEGFIMKKKFIHSIICIGLLITTFSTVGIPIASAAVPTQPSQPVPATGSSGVTIFIELKWICNESGLTYDVYFGNQSPPPLVVINQPENTYRPSPRLQLDTMFYWQIVARNSQQETNQSPIWSFTTADDSPPFAPVILNGPPAAGPGIDLEFATVAPDPEGDQVYYQWDWGDGNISEWLGPYAFGEQTKTYHQWAQNGSYDIKAHARDPLGKESDWSSIFHIAISPQIHFENLAPGFLYFNFWIFDQTYGYVNALDQLDMAFVISTGGLTIKATGSDSVRTVIFEIANRFFTDERWNATTTNLTGNYFEGGFTLITGFYQSTVTAYDADGRLIDRATRENIGFYVHQFIILKQLLGT
jgi:PKD domain